MLSLDMSLFRGAMCNGFVCRCWCLHCGCVFRHRPKKKPPGENPLISALGCDRRHKLVYLCCLIQRNYDVCGPNNNLQMAASVPHRASSPHFARSVVQLFEQNFCSRGLLVRVTSFAGRGGIVGWLNVAAKTWATSLLFDCANAGSFRVVTLNPYFCHGSAASAKVTTVNLFSRTNVISTHLHPY